MTELCDEVDRTDVVLFVEDAASATGARAVQTVRGFCRVPATRAIEPSASELEALAAAWRAEGRQLILISEAPLGSGGVEVSLAWESLERTVESRPEDAAQGRLDLGLSPAE